MIPPRCEILHILPSLETGGAETMVVLLAGELANEGLDTGVISFFEPQGSQLERALQANRVPVWSLGKRLGLDLAVVGKLRRLLDRLQPQIVHTHLSALRYVIPAVIGLRKPPRIVHTVHRVAERDSETWLRWLQRRCLRRCAQVIAVSEEVAHSCARIYAQTKIAVIPNGISIHDRAPSSSTRSQVRRNLGINDGDFVYCCVARLRPVKNHKALLKAFAGLAADTNAHLLLVGDGELRDQLEMLAGALQISGRVHFLGEREDVVDLLAASDAFVLASFSEGIPLSVLEAMGAGLPVIATDVGGLPEIITNGMEGLLVPPGDIDALQASMARIVLDRQSRLAMARAANQKVRNKFDLRGMVRSYRAAYELLGVKAAIESV